MNCEILRTLYLRSNGEIPCNCATGERVNLGWALGEEGWDIAEIFENENFTTIRESFAKNRAPWGAFCEKCPFWVPNEPMDDQLRNKWIEKFQVEPALTCALRCPGCSRADQIKRRRPPFVMSEDIFRQTLDSLKRNEFRIGYFYFCGQGEPLNHPRFQEMAILAKDRYPDSRQIVNTNGNHSVAEKFDPEKFVPDSFIVSIDGLDQSSYEQYRVNGDVAMALKFMKDLKSLPNPPHVEWKYILFTYNDSDEEIRRAQEKAIELGVDRIQFVLTHSKEKSQRFTIDNIDELELLPGVGYHQSTPQLYYTKEKAIREGFRGEEQSKGITLEVEGLSRNEAGLLMLQSVLSGRDLEACDRIEVRDNGDPLGSVDLKQTRRGIGRIPFVLSKKGTDLQQQEHRLEFQLWCSDESNPVIWEFDYSFAEAKLHKHVVGAM